MGRSAEVDETVNVEGLEEICTGTLTLVGGELVTSEIGAATGGDLREGIIISSESVY